MRTPTLLSLVAALSVLPIAQAITVNETFSNSYSLSSGLVSDDDFRLFEMNEAWTIQSITEVRVHLRIAGTQSPAPNSDLTAALILGEEFIGAAVLFEGTSLSSTGGGSVSLDVQFDSKAATAIAAAAGPLNGTYAPTEDLNAAFSLLDARNTWFLNISDLGGVGESALLFWELEITGDDGRPNVQVPEPLFYTSWFALLGTVGFHHWSRRRRKA